MNLRQIETFYWAAKLGSFAAAAERLNATQSTVSMRIHEIEEAFGVSLFDRVQRTARVTPKGRELLRYAEDLLKIASEMRQRIADPKCISGVLRLGIVEMISISWLPQLVRLAHKQFPNVSLELDEALTLDLVDRLQEGQLDLILVPGRIRDPRINQLSLGFVDFAWMAGSSVKMPKKIMTPHDLCQFPVIALAKESYHHKWTQEWFSAANVPRQRIDTCKSFGVASALARAGLGVTLLPPRCYLKKIKQKRLQVVRTQPEFRPVEFTAVWWSGGVQPLAKNVAELAAEVSDYDK